MGRRWCGCLPCFSVAGGLAWSLVRYADFFCFCAVYSLGIWTTVVFTAQTVCNLRFVFLLSFFSWFGQPPQRSRLYSCDLNAPNSIEAAYSQASFISSLHLTRVSDFSIFNHNTGSLHFTTLISLHHLELFKVFSLFISPVLVFLSSLLCSILLFVHSHPSLYIAPCHPRFFSTCLSILFSVSLKKKKIDQHINFFTSDHRLTVSFKGRE